MSAAGFLNRDRLLECVHCGLCLNACPTYVELGTEMDSPRGRIYLMRGLDDGSLPLSDDVVRHFDLCLGCRACEPACPSGVRYGELIESTRAYIESNHRRAPADRALRRAIRAVFPRARQMRPVLASIRFLQRVKVWGALRTLAAGAELVPALERTEQLPEINPAQGGERARVGLLAGCVAGELFGATNRAIIEVLNRNGVAVVVPAEALCCGALHVHSGDPQGARRRARAVIERFADSEAILANAAGCGATMKEYGALFTGDAEWRERAGAFAARVRDVTEYLADLPLEAPQRGLDLRVAYHDACHLAHAQGIREAPRRLLRSIPGVELVDLAEADLCCGSAGSYNLTEPEMARRLGARKAENIERSGATCVASANPGCTLQIKAALRSRGLDIRVAHPVELLAEAYRDR